MEETLLRYLLMLFSASQLPLPSTSPGLHPCYLMPATTRCPSYPMPGCNSPTASPKAVNFSTNCSTTAFQMTYT